MTTAPAQEGRWFRNFFGVSAGNYGAIALSFLLNMILTRRLGTEAFGQLALLVMAVQVLACLVANWTMTGLVRFGAQEYARAGTVVQTFWARLIVIAPWLLAASVVTALGQGRAATYFGVSPWAVWLGFGYFLLSSLLATFGAVFQACQQMPRYAATLFLDKALALAGVLSLPVALAGDPAMVIGCYAMSSLLVSVWAGSTLGAGLLWPWQADCLAVREFWRFSLPLILSMWVGMMGTQWVNYAIIKHYLALSDLGLYSLANQLAGVAQQVTIISSSLLLPHFSVLVAGERHAEIGRLVERAVPYGLMGFSLLVSVGILLAGLGVPLIFGAAFTGSVAPLIILLIATMGLALFNTFMPLVSAQGMTWALTGITLVSALVNLVAALLLIPAYGVNGAAWATVLTYGSAAALVLALVEWRLKVPALRCAWLGLPVLVVALCAAVLDGGVFYLAGLAGLGLSVLALVVLFRLFRQEDLAVLAWTDMSVGVKSGLSKVFSVRAG